MKRGGEESHALLTQTTWMSRCKLTVVKENPTVNDQETDPHHS